MHGTCEIWPHNLNQHLHILHLFVLHEAATNTTDQDFNTSILYAVIKTSYSYWHSTKYYIVVHWAPNITLWSTGHQKLLAVHWEPKFTWWSTGHHNLVHWEHGTTSPVDHWFPVDHYVKNGAQWTTTWKMVPSGPLWCKWCPVDHYAFVIPHRSLNVSHSR